MDSQKIEPQYACWGAAASIAFFCALNRVVSAALQPPPAASADADTKWKWKNLLISWIHAFVCGCWVLSNLFLYPEFMDDLISHFSAWSYAMVCFSVGYFTYDFFDMLIHKKLLILWELVAHHVAITSVMIYNLLTCTCIAWNIVALSAEVNSFFLHSRKLMQMYSIPRSHPLTRANMVANMATFVVFRFGSAALISAGMMLQHHRVTTTYLVMLGLCMVVMNLVNPILFYRLLRSDVLSSSRDRRKIAVCDGSSETSSQNGETERKDFAASIMSASKPGCSGSLSRRLPKHNAEPAKITELDSRSCETEMPFLDLSAPHCMQSAFSICNVNGSVKMDKLG